MLLLANLTGCVDPGAVAAGEPGVEAACDRDTDIPGSTPSGATPLDCHEDLSGFPQTDDWLFTLGTALPAFRLTLSDPTIDGSGAKDTGAMLEVEGMGTVCDVTVQLKGSPYNSYQPVSSKPYVKISFPTAADPDRTISGVDSFRLYNQWQDESQVQRFLGYMLWRDMGRPAPRAAFGELTLDGRWLGLYGINEDVASAPFRARWLEDADDLYEGEYGADLTNEDYGDGTSRVDHILASCTGDCASVDALRQVADAVDGVGALPSAGVADLVDLTADFWSLELIVGAREGFTFARNNFYIYHRARSARGSFQLVPWGFDQVLYDHVPPEAASSKLARQALDGVSADLSQAYWRALAYWLDRMDEPRDGLTEWQRLAAEMDTAIAVIGPTYEAEIAAYPDERPWHADDIERTQAEVRGYLDRRGDLLRAELP